MCSQCRLGNVILHVVPPQALHLCNTHRGYTLRMAVETANMRIFAIPFEVELVKIHCEKSCNQSRMFLHKNCMHLHWTSDF